MKKKDQGLIALVLLLVVAIGVGFAAASNKSLTINGTASATASDFDIQFSNEASDITTDKSGDATLVEAAYASTEKATITVSKLKNVNDYGSATFTVLNKSVDVAAKITASVTADINDTEHYKVETVMGAGSEKVAAKSGKTTVTVKVTLIKAFADEDTAKEAKTFTVTVNGEALEA